MFDNLGWHRRGNSGKHNSDIPGTASNRRTALVGTAVGTALAVVLLRRSRRNTAAAPAPDTAHAAAEPAAAPHEPIEVPPERPLEFGSVPAHFAATALGRPDQVALQTPSGTVTYGELHAAVSRQAAVAPTAHQPRAALLSAPMTPGTVATILGLFASRTVVVAVDPAMPDNRVEKISAVLAEHGYHVSEVDPPVGIPQATDMPDALTVDVELDDVTSIQFTSGSTGTPKAVLHTNGLWLVDAQLLNDRFGLADGRKVALCMPISFAGGLNVLIGSLVGGAEIVGIDPREHSAREAFDRIGSSGAQIITCTPAFVDALHSAARGATLPGVKRIVTTGEPAHPRHVRLARELAPHAVFTNWVGSTETLAIASHDIPPTAPLPHGVIPVGIPAPHKRIRIGDDGGVSISSRHLGMGYLDPTASTATFTDNPDGTKTYAGGDVGRWDEAGNLVFSGRVDNTVKIRGYLVEPAEIESTLLSYEDIREATVVADTTGTPTLIAYVSPSTTTRTPAVAELRTRLHRDLPPWMVPAHIVELPALPRSERGKVDRMALPKPGRPVFDPPQGHHESLIAELWAEILRVDAVGRSDSFYAMGGDSLSAADMLARIRKSHGLPLHPSDLAGAPTVAEFAVTLSGGAQPGTQLNRTTVPLRPLSPDTGVTPWFCFPGAGASSLTFAPLAARIGSGTAVYAMEPKGLEKRAVPDLSVRGAALRHLKDLRRIQPHGPYVLIGHSLGAHIALETARQLENMGETVDLLVMLDPWLSPRAAREARRDMPDVKVTLEETVPTDLKSWWQHQKKVPLAGLLIGGNTHKSTAIEEVGVIIGMRHRPQPWAGRALVILSHLNRDDPRLWPRFLTGDLTVRTQECDHNSIVREPHVGDVIAMIDEALSQRG